MGRTIDIRATDGSGSFKGYVAVPAAGKGPGIVLCQEIFGVNASMRAVADYYAEEGYVVVAPDLFWRQVPGIELGYTEADYKFAFELYKGFNEDKGTEDVGAALAALRALPEFAGKVGVLGFCLGGKLAYLAACRLKDVACAVAYYGVGIEKINSMCVQFSIAERQAFFAVKSAFDEAGLLNPGKAIPTLARCAEYGKLHVHAGQLPHPDLPRF